MTEGNKDAFITKTGYPTFPGKGEDTLLPSV